MPIGTPTTLGSPVALLSAGTTVALTTSAQAPAGSYILLTVSNPPGQTVSSATDSNANSYTVGATATDPGSNGRITRLYARTASALASSSTITVTFSASTSHRMMSAAYVTGLASSSVLDGSGTGSQSDATTWVTSAVNTTNADDLLYASCLNIIGEPDHTAGASYTELHQFTLGAQNRVADEYRIVSSTGSYTGTGDWDGSASGRRLASVVTALKMEASGAVTITPVTQTNTAQALSYGKVYQGSWGDLGIEYGMLPFSGENFTGESGRRRYSLPPMSP
jgi:hypothetical protein